MNLLELIPRELHGLGDYVVLGFLSLASLLLVRAVSTGTKQMLATGGMAIFVAVSFYWTWARHQWVESQLAATEAKVKRAEADVAARDAKIAEHEKAIQELQGNIAKLQPAIAADEAAAAAAGRDLDARIADESKLREELEAKEKALGEPAPGK